MQLVTIARSVYIAHNGTLEDRSLPVPPSSRRFLTSTRSPSSIPTSLTLVSYTLFFISTAIFWPRLIFCLGIMKKKAQNMLNCCLVISWSKSKNDICQQPTSYSRLLYTRYILVTMSRITLIYEVGQQLNSYEKERVS